MFAYCVGCRGKKQVLEAYAEYNKIGRPVVTGKCNVGHKMYTVRRLPQHDEIDKIMAEKGIEKPKAEPRGECTHEGVLLEDIRNCDVSVWDITRDYQKRLVYKSEIALRGTKLSTWTEMQDFVNSVTNSVWWKNRVGDKHISVALFPNRRRTAYAALMRNTIEIPGGDRWAWTKITLLHELCHWWAWSNHEPWHGREFTSKLLKMVRRFMGDEAWKQLKDEYKSRGVKYYSLRRTK